LGGVWRDEANCSRWRVEEPGMDVEPFVCRLVVSRVCSSSNSPKKDHLLPWWNGVISLLSTVPVVCLAVRLNSKIARYARVCRCVSRGKPVFLRASSSSRASVSSYGGYAPKPHTSHPAPKNNRSLVLSTTSGRPSGPAAQIDRRPLVYASSPFLETASFGFWLFGSWLSSRICIVIYFLVAVGSPRTTPSN